MEDPTLEYSFLQHFYTADKLTYETILRECLNKSRIMVSLFCGNFSRVTNQSNGESDVIVYDSGYELDFKMMVSQTFKEFQSLSAPKFQEVAPGVKSLILPRQVKQEVSLIWNLCRNINEEKLQQYRTKKDKGEKEITYFFDKVIKQNKNILLFIPLYFNTVDKELPPKKQYDTIFKELSSTTEYIYDFRNKYCHGFDTFIIYIVNIPQNREFSFIIAKFTSNGFEFIDKVPMFSLDSIIKLTLDNEAL